MATAGRIGDTVASQITTGLMTMVTATQSVSEAWRQMGKAILDTIAQIAMNEGFRLLINLGIRAAFGVVGGAAGGSAVNPAAGSIAAQNISALGFQHGGVVASPTLAMLGENPATRPEYILTRQHMESLMRATPSAGGQAAGQGLTIINVPNQQAAAEEAAKQRSMGREVIINTVMSELSQGSGSRLGQVIRTIQR
jgi:hypothetical protein